MSADFFTRLAAECAARHRIPKATVQHPAGVIVQGDPFMTDKLRDPDYVPYCFGTYCGRTRRTEFGFQCPTCGNKMNYDLTHYNGNIHVWYEDGPQVLSIERWNAAVDARKAARAERRAQKGSQ